MQRGEMNEVSSTEADTEFCNHKWFALGSTLAATSLVGWMYHDKCCQLPRNKQGKYSFEGFPQENILNAYEHRSYLRNQKDRLFFWGGC